MTSEFLLEAIGQMDDDLVMEAAAPTRRSIPWAKVSGWAAALVLCVGVASLPGLLPMNGAGSGATAPESDFILGDVMLDQDTNSDGYEYRSDQESQAQEPSAAGKENSKSEAAGTTQGIMEPQFFTQRGVYLLTGDDFPYKHKLPDTESLKELGVLVAAAPGEQVYPSTGTQDLVGCPVWESENGKALYIQLKDGDWLFARLYE